MLKLKTFAAAILAAGALSACSVESIVDDINNAAIDSAFDIIKQSVEAQGGAAARVKPGQEVILEVTNTASPIAGATVKVPANALPSDVEIAAVSIYHLPVIDGANEDVVVHGNGALIAVTKLPGLEEVVLAAPVTISLPITTTSTKPIEQIVLGSSDIGAGGIVAVEGSKGDAAKKQAVGDATNLKNAFAASWKVDYTGGAADADTLIYKVTKADASVCVGARSLAEGANLVASISNTGFDYQFTLAVGLTNPVAYTHTQATNYAALPTATSATIPVVNTFAITCGGSAYAADGTITKGDLSVTNWLQSSESATVGGTTHIGSATIVGEVDYTTTAGDHVQAAFSGSKTDFNWFTNP